MLKTLLKKEMTQFFGSMAKNKKGEVSRKSRFWFIVLYAICYVSLAFAFVGMSSMYAEAILPTGQNWLYYSLIAMTTVALSVFGTSFSAYSCLYNAKDNDSLLALPINPINILLSRSITIYILDLLFASVCFFPGMILYWIKVGITFTNFICPIILFIGLSIVILCLSCFFGWIIALITHKAKKKNVVSLVFSLLVFGGYYIFYFNVQKILSKVIETALKTKFSMHFVGDAATGNILALVIVLLVVAAIFFFTLYIMSKNFITIATTNVSAAKKEYKRDVKLEVNSVRKTLFRKELKRFTSSATYMLNSGLGILMMPVAAIILLVKRDAITPLASLLPAGMTPVLAFAVVVIACAMNTMSASAISLEGKNFWISRSLPIDAYAALEAKIRVHEALTIPPALILAIVAAFTLKLEFTSAVYMIANVYVVVSVMAMVGLVLNLKMPKLNWTTEVDPIKRSLPVAIVLFGGWLFGLIIFGIYYLLRNVLSGESFLLAFLVILIMISRLLSSWIKNKGVKIYNEL